jgi:hypothetical protein
MSSGLLYLVRSRKAFQIVDFRFQIERRVSSLGGLECSFANATQHSRAGLEKRPAPAGLCLWRRATRVQPHGQSKLHCLRWHHPGRLQSARWHKLSYASELPSGCSGYDQSLLPLWDIEGYLLQLGLLRRLRPHLSGVFVCRILAGTQLQKDDLAKPYPCRSWPNYRDLLRLRHR